jgi:alanine racemase
MSMGNAEVRVDLDAYRANIACLREVAPRSAMMAVVKADAYGHGMVACARAARQAGATWLGTATADEALELRAAGVDGRVLTWIATPGAPWQRLLAADVDVSANAPWAVAEIAAAAAATGVTARLHLKTDTGLGRAGAQPHDWPELVDAALKAQADGLVSVVGLWSHLACADEPTHPSVPRQLAAFRDAVDHAERAGVRPEVRHLANSPATLLIPASHHDLVRCGIATYGLSPAPAEGAAADFGLRPVMTLAARLALVKRVPEGHGVSYGHTYVTTRQTTLALVPVGYGDGVPRAASNLAEVYVAGRRHTIAGRVAMDQFVVDLGDSADEARPGDEVVIFGPGDRGEPTAQDWAEAMGTISYEIVTRIGARVPRRYVGSR